MHDPQLNPTTNPLYSRKRKATRSVAVRSVRLDAASETALEATQRAFPGKTPEDALSVSMVVRRAVQHYWQWLQEAILTDPHVRECEGAILRRNSRMPPRKHERGHDGNQSAAPRPGQR
jgi:hypothetical protein